MAGGQAAHCSGPHLPCSVHGSLQGLKPRSAGAGVLQRAVGGEAHLSESTPNCNMTLGTLPSIISAPQLLSLGHTCSQYLHRQEPTWFSACVFAWPFNLACDVSLSLLSRETIN